MAGSLVSAAAAWSDVKNIRTFDTGKLTVSATEVRHVLCHPGRKHLRVAVHDCFHSLPIDKEKNVLVNDISRMVELLVPQ